MTAFFKHPVWAMAFRPFYSLAALYGALSILLWGFGYTGTPELSNFYWHAHEMIWGYAGLVVIAFLLTAVATWTGQPPTRGGVLAGLTAFWLAARIAVFIPGWGATASGILGTLFFWYGAVCMALPVIRSKNFSKHIHDGQTVQKVRSIWASIPEQLAKENKKFIYAQLQKGARSKDYEIALQWLKDSGLVHGVPRVKKPHLPLSAYQDNAFKLYGLDVGLLAAQSNLDASVLLEGSRIFTEFKGALTEQYVLQQLIATQENPVFYWATEKGTAEVDFVVQRKQAVIPIEVKAEENLKAKSLKVYVEQFQPKQAIRFSMADYREQDWMINVPLYAF